MKSRESLSTRSSRYLLAMGFALALGPVPAGDATAQPACAASPSSVAWWPLDASLRRSPLAHEIGQGFDGEFSHPPVFVIGRVDSAVAFSGGSHVRVPDETFLDFEAGQDFSIDLWVKTEQDSGLATLLEKRDNQADARGYQLFLFEGNPGLQMATGSGSNNCSPAATAACTNWVSDTSVADGEWHFVAVTVDRDGVGRFYVDGAPAGTFDPAVRAGSLANTGDLLLGQQGVLGSSPLEGVLDEVEVFRRVLSAEEVEALWQAGPAGKCKEVSIGAWDTPFCSGEHVTRAEINLCNQTTAAQAYDVTVIPLVPGELPQVQCNVPGANGVVVGAQPSVVPALSCSAVEVEFARPPGLVGDAQSCFRVELVNQATGTTWGAVGSLVSDDRVCASPGASLWPLRPELGVLTFDLLETAELPGPLDWTLEVFGPDMEPDEEVVSLDGAEAGIPAHGVANFDEQGRATVGVTMSAAQPRSFEAYSVVLFADSDGDGEAEALASTSLLPTQDPCVNAGGELCLAERFRVEVTWTDFQGNTGSGRAVPLTEDTGYFWFFRSTNVELVLKVLDGRPINDHFWVFYGALSNVAYEITVTDTETGFVKTYVNPAGQFASRGDTTAIPDGGGTAPASPAAAVEVPHRLDEAAFTDPADVELLTAASHGCTADATALCLNADRFRVSVEWTDFAGNMGVGQAVPLTSDTGYFWFFDDSNVELIVKVLDGRPVNGNWWVFYGALSNVEYRVRVEDTLTDSVRTYFNEARKFGSVGDTAAFPQ
ncbi:MAG TPA: LamG domain-containing protein [Thermoanaerobaculia bacterium]|nr:LamG domain-containing protein [Thermoanaerobaculia bacterium]